MSDGEKKSYRPFAFPSPETDRTYFEPGMTLRDYQATAFAAALIADGTYLGDEEGMASIALTAHEMADAMRREREKSA